MKKLIIPAIAVLLISGVASAQTTQPTPKKASTSKTAKTVSPTDKSMTSSTTVTPKKATQPTVANKTAINRKKKNHAKAKKTKG